MRTDLDVLLVEDGDQVPHEAVVGEEALVLAVDVHLQVLLALVGRRAHQLQDELVLQLGARALRLAVLPVAKITY